MGGCFEHRPSPHDTWRSEVRVDCMLARRLIRESRDREDDTVPARSLIAQRRNVHWAVECENAIDRLAEELIGYPSN